MDVVSDIWRAARDEIDVAEVIRNHGFHGPHEGEISSVVWREDPTPIQNVMEHYAALPDDQSPARLETEKLARMEAKRELV